MLKAEGVKDLNTHQDLTTADARTPQELRRTHLIPENPEHWRIENLEHFLEKRK